MARFDGKTILITGASSGIGLETARYLAGKGARIVAVARDASRLRDAMASLSGDGHEAWAADAGDWTAMKDLIKVGRTAGGFAGAVLAAGAHHMAPLALEDEAGLRDLYNANVVSAVTALKVVAKAANEGASVVLLSSVAAIRGSAGFLAYAAAKGALASVAKTAAVELAGRRIRVNTIVAGVVKTELSRAWLSKLSDDQRAQVESQHLLGLGSPSDVAEAAAFLLSDAA